MAELYRKDDQGALRFRFHRAQQEVWDSTARFPFFVAGTQSGKTSFGPWWLWREIARNGGGDYLAATASYDLFKLKMLPEIRAAFETTLGMGRYWSGDKIIELRNPETGRFDATRADDPMWGRIILRSAEAAGGLESTSAKAAWLDECGQDSFTIDSWYAVRRRLSLSRGRILGTTTPYNLGWLKTEVIDRWQAGDGSYHVVQAESVVNPAFSAAEFEEMRDSMPAWKFDMFYRGQMSRPAGMIYGSYLDSAPGEGGQLVADFPIPASWPRYVGTDFGAVNEAFIWLAHDPDRDVIYAYRESLEGGRTTAEHAAAALAHAAAENVVVWAGGAKSENQKRWDYADAGVPMRDPVVTEVEVGIDRVIAMFKTRRLFVFESLRGLRSELGSYQRKLDGNGQPTPAIADKATFHRLDALRYIVQHIGAPALTIGGI